MNKKARNELICVVIGAVMIAVGVGLFISKTEITSEFLAFGGVWSWWKTVLILLPLAAGIVMLIIKPNLLASRLVAAFGAILAIAAIFINTTIIIEEKIAVYEWIIYGVLVFGGIIVSFAALFIKRNKNKI